MKLGNFKDKGLKLTSMYLSSTSDVSVKKFSSFILVNNFELQLKHEILLGTIQFQHVTVEEVSNSFFLQNHI